MASTPSGARNIGAPAKTRHGYAAGRPPQPTRTRRATIAAVNVGSLGAIFCGIGAFLTLPIAFIGFYHMARQITDGGPLVITQA